MVFTTTGKEEIMKWMAGDSSTAPTHIATGVGTISANESDSSLGSEVGREAINSTSRDGKKVTYTITLDSLQLNGNDLTEVGLLNASTNGDLFQRSVFAAISKTNAFEIQVDITVKMK